MQRAQLMPGVAVGFVPLEHGDVGIEREILGAQARATHEHEACRDAERVESRHRAASEQLATCDDGDGEAGHSSP